MEYRVRWEIDVDADTEHEAAAKALRIQLDPESTACVFDVAPKAMTDDPYRRIDLSKSKGDK